MLLFEPITFDPNYNKLNCDPIKRYVFISSPLGRSKRIVERGSSVVECRTRNQVIPGSNPPLLPFRRLGIFFLSINAPVDSAV